jgi:hypothetical protein
MYNHLPFYGGVSALHEWYHFTKFVYILPLSLVLLYKASSGRRLTDWREMLSPRKRINVALSRKSDWATILTCTRRLGKGLPRLDHLSAEEGWDCSGVWINSTGP